MGATNLNAILGSQTVFLTRLTLDIKVVPKKVEKNLTTSLNIVKGTLHIFLPASII